MTEVTLPYRVFRRRWPMIPALIFGIAQVLAGIDTLFTHMILRTHGSPAITLASVMLIVLGTLLSLFVGIQLFRPRPLIEATNRGLLLGITQAGMPPVHIPWSALKSAELGQLPNKASSREDPPCFILRFHSGRVSLPQKMVGVLHQTKGALYIRASHIANAQQAVMALNTLLMQHQTSSSSRAHDQSPHQQREHFSSC